MEWVETTGKTVEEAKEAALDQLGVDDTDAEFVVVSEPRAGLFGRVKGEARVRARVMPTSPRPKRARSRRPEPRRSNDRQPRSGGSSNGGRGRPSAPVAVAERNGDAPADAGSADGGAEGAAPPTGARRRRRRGGRGRGSGAGSAANGAARAENGGSTSEGAPGGAGARGSGVGQGSSSARRPRAAEGAKEEVVGEVLTLEEQGQTARDFIDGLVRELGLTAEVALRVVDEDTVEITVDGAELGILIGPGGATVGALQELARTVVQKRTGGQSERILVDVAGYRARRAEALQRFTRQIADEVIESGEERALEAMSASDRKVVHDAVNDIDGVVTRSEGEDPRRYVVIAPGRSDDA